MDERNYYGNQGRNRWGWRGDDRNIPQQRSRDNARDWSRGEWEEDANPYGERSFGSREDHVSSGGRSFYRGDQNEDFMRGENRFNSDYRRNDRDYEIGRRYLPNFPRIGRGKGPKNFRRSDERIMEDICQRFEQNDIDATEIDVQVKECEVILKGVVQERRERRLAEEIVEGVWGVKDVRNEIRVGTAVGDGPALKGSDRNRGRSK